LKYISNEWSEQHKELGKMIRKADYFEQSVELFLNIHSQLHSEVVSTNKSNYINPLIDDLVDNEYSIMPESKDETIAWVMWHIARIEDLTMNILIADNNQVFDDEWKIKMNSPINDTGNALTDDEIMKLSKSLCIKELLEYRNEVGIRTQEIVKSLKPEDMKKKVHPDKIKRVLKEGGVTSHKDSIWLLEFWGSKDYAGLLLMPPTRHVTLHINDCYKWKDRIRAKKKCYRN